MSFLYARRVSDWGSGVFTCGRSHSSGFGLGLTKGQLLSQLLQVHRRSCSGSEHSLRFELSRNASRLLKEFSYSCISRAFHDQRQSCLRFLCYRLLLISLCLRWRGRIGYVSCVRDLGNGWLCSHVHIHRGSHVFWWCRRFLQCLGVLGGRRRFLNSRRLRLGDRRCWFCSCMSRWFAIVTWRYKRDRLVPLGSF